MIESAFHNSLLIACCAELGIQVLIRHQLLAVRQRSLEESSLGAKLIVMVAVDLLDEMKLAGKLRTRMSKVSARRSMPTMN